jgi:hypothetical protein
MRRFAPGPAAIIRMYSQAGWSGRVELAEIDPPVPFAAGPLERSGLEAEELHLEAPGDDGVAALVDDGGDDTGGGDEDDPCEAVAAKQMLGEGPARPEDERSDLREGGERGDGVACPNAGAIASHGSRFGGGDCGAGLGFSAGDGLDGSHAVGRLIVDGTGVHDP